MSDELGPDDGLLSEAVWLSMIGPAVDQLTDEIGQIHAERAAAEVFNLRRAAYREARWPHRHPAGE